MKPEHPSLQQMPALRVLWQEAFGDTDAFLDGFFSTAFAPEHCLCIAPGERVLSVAYWLDVELDWGKGAYIYAVATAKDSRGRGFAHSVLAAIHERLQEQGYVAAILVPGTPDLAQLYASMGYRFFGGVKNISAVAQKPAAPLRKLSGEEYACMRRMYLPSGAVCQEQENIRFLETYADLYAGEDFLLAAWQEKDTLSGLELLGNASCAPQILEALGAKQGSFRTPGDDPFAMWLPLESGEEPTYFGIAFD